MFQVPTSCCRDGEGATPLHRAVAGSHSETAQESWIYSRNMHHLITFPAKASHGKFPFVPAITFNFQHHAGCRVCRLICQMLLDRGCPLDVADSRAGDTVLHLATRAGDNALLAVLLRKGANPDIANKVQFAYVFVFFLRRNTKGKFCVESDCYLLFARKQPHHYFLIC